MKVKKAIILSAGFGKRLNPLTLTNPKPLLKIKDKTLLENTIDILIKFGIEKIWINTHYFAEKIQDYIQKKNFNCLINVTVEKGNILDTGGGILNISNNFINEPFFVINPDTIWSTNYLNEFKIIEEMYFSKKLKNILLVVSYKKSFDKNLKGDFKLEKNILYRNNIGKNKYIYTGLQLMNNEIFKGYKIEPFSINSVWDKLITKSQLYGFESQQNFLHITNLEIYKKLYN
jgi:MurNAc alpha-1-phosphate uridylyltransferase